VGNKHNTLGVFFADELESAPVAFFGVAFFVDFPRFSRRSIKQITNCLVK
jgi:hypothetical protein